MRSLESGDAGPIIEWRVMKMNCRIQKSLRHDVAISTDKYQCMPLNEYE